MTLPRRGGAPRGFRKQDTAVSPIVGSILILVIMIMSIAGILGWGVPAIQGLQDHAEFQSVLTQFLQMASDVRNLRDPQNTREVRLSLAGGVLSYGSGSRWVISAARDAAYNDFHLTGWEGPNPASVTLGGIPPLTASSQVTVDEVTGGSFATRTSCTGVGCSTVSLGTAPNNVALDTDVARIQLKEGTVKAEAWILNVGRITYRQAFTGISYIHFEMGAVFTQQDKVFFIDESPATKDPDYALTPEDTNLFVRALQLTGSAASQSGKGRYPILFNLVDNYGSSRGRPSFDPATMVRFQIDGDLEAAFCNYYDKRANWDNQNTGGAVAMCPDEGTSGFVSLRYNPGADRLTYDLNHAVVTTIVRSI